MKIYSDRLKLFFAQIIPSFTCTYLALVFNVKKLKSILVKKLAAYKKRMVDIGYIPCNTQIYQFSWLRQKKSIKSTLTTSIWQTHKDHYKKNFIRSQNWWQIFLCKIPNLHPNSFSFKQCFIFFGLYIVCQLLARRLSKEIETMKIYSDRLKLFFAQIGPSFTCTYLALVFSVKKLKSILVKKLAACKKRMVDIGYIQCITQIYQFSWLRQKKSIKSTLTISIWQTQKDHYKNFLSGHRIDDRFSYARFEIYIQAVFHSNSFLFFCFQYCLSATGSSPFKTDRNNEKLFR